MNKTEILVLVEIMFQRREQTANTGRVNVFYHGLGPVQGGRQRGSGKAGMVGLGESVAHYFQLGRQGGLPGGKAQVKN